MTTKAKNPEGSASIKQKNAAPDGGSWGWFIVMAYGTANVSLTP
jgi:hypothetical protein